jgi:ribulose-phosphate 3-epimerase
VIEILPSILAADFAHLARDAERVAEAGVSTLHVDVMDGHFVPNISIGVPVVASLRKATPLKLDVHLMIEQPDHYVEAFARAGADSISVHQEACPHLDRTVRLIQSTGAMAGVVLNPATPLHTLDEILGVADFVLLMSVNPGFGGQQFLPRVLEKARALDFKRRSLGLGFPIEIDGGITAHNIGDCVRAGVDWFVCGSSVFGAPDPAQAVHDLMREAREASAVQA